MSSRLAAKDLRFSYRRGTADVFDPFTHDFASGAVTCIVGPSGCGKSTLLYLLGLLLTPRSGAVLWDGVPTSSLRDGERSRVRALTMGFVFQDAILDASRSVLDNVCESGLLAGQTRAESEPRALELLDTFGVSGRSDHRPGEISGGQAQRVALCRALLTDPPVVLGDEPTGNLDEVSADVVWGALAAQADRGSTVVVVTHDRSRARLADIVLDLAR